MTKEYSIELTLCAQEQIIQIGQYIITEFHAPNTAVKIVDELETEISKLNIMPERVPLVDLEPWHSKGIHKYIIGNYIAYFIILETELTVRVTAVAFSKMNQKTQLELMELKL